MRAYFVDGRGTTEREVFGELGQLRQEYRLTPDEEVVPVSEGMVGTGSFARFYHREFTLRRFLIPVYASQEARLAGERPLMHEEIAAYVEDGCDPDRALANLVSHIGPYKYAAAP